MESIFSFMFTAFIFVLYAILLFIILFLFFSTFTDIEFLESLTKKIKKCYEYIRQHFCKKSDEVNDDSGTVHDSTEFYDSSSVWED